MSSVPTQNIRSASRIRPFIRAPLAGLGIGALLVGAAYARHRDANDQTLYTIKRIYKTGEVDRYRVTLHVNLDTPPTSSDMTLAFVMKETTQNAKDDGASTSVSEFENASATVNGIPHDPLPAMPKIITTRDKSGQADVKLEGTAQQTSGKLAENMKEATNFSAAFMPARPVKIGDTWEMSAANFGVTHQKVKGKVNLVTVDTRQGKKVAKLRSVSDMTGMADLKTHTETVAFVDLATGKLLNMTSKAAGDASSGKLRMETTLKMLDR